MREKKRRQKKRREEESEVRIGFRDKGEENKKGERIEEREGEGLVEGKEEQWRAIKGE